MNSLKAFPLFAAFFFLLATDLAFGNHVCSICHHAIGYYNYNTLPCGHVFHQQCLAPWFHCNSCPICRTPIHYNSPWPNQPWRNTQNVMQHHLTNVHNVMQHSLPNVHNVAQHHLETAQRLQSDAMANAQRVQTEAAAQMARAATAASRRMGEEARAANDAQQPSHGAENRAQTGQGQNNWVVIDGVRHQIDGPNIDARIEGTDLIVNGQRFANAATRQYSIISGGNINHGDIGYGAFGYRHFGY